jgi:glutaredoxin
VQILDHLGVEFIGVDVLQDDDLRQGVKTFTDWPTIPQLYVKGEFVGGSDIIREMFQSGELKTLPDRAGRDRGVSLQAKCVGVRRPRGAPSSRERAGTRVSRSFVPPRTPIP